MSYIVNAIGMVPEVINAASSKDAVASYLYGLDSSFSGLIKVETPQEIVVYQARIEYKDSGRQC